MKIAIDIRKVFDSGIGTYIRNLLEDYDSIDNGHDYLLLAAPGDIEKLRGLNLGQSDKFEIVPISSGKYSLAELWTPARVANRFGVDTYHATHFTLPFGVKARKVVTIYDITPLRFPEYFARHKRVAARAIFAHACRSSDVIMTISEFTRRDLIAEFGVREDKVRVAHLGANPVFRTVSDEARRSFREKFDIHGRYAFYAGNFKGHKNIVAAIEALARVPDGEIESLVLVGGQLDQLPMLAQRAEELKLGRRLRVLGKVDIDDLVAAYNEAFVAVLPSRYEGFGFPVLEAMACGTPVVCSNAASLPEVAGDAALTFAPDDIELFTAHLRRLAQDAALRRDLIEKGFERLSHFSARDTALATLGAYTS